MCGTYLLLVGILTIYLNLGLAFNPPPLCLLPHSLDGIGDMKCNQHLERYSYDSDKKTCVSFKFGGCGGNKNNFMDLTNCEEDCMGKYSHSEQTHSKASSRTKGSTSNSKVLQKARTKSKRKGKNTNSTSEALPPHARTHVKKKELHPEALNKTQRK